MAQFSSWCVKRVRCRRVREPEARSSIARSYTMQTNTPAQLDGLFSIHVSACVQQGARALHVCLICQANLVCPFVHCGPQVANSSYTSAVFVSPLRAVYVCKRQCVCVGVWVNMRMRVCLCNYSKFASEQASERASDEQQCNFIKLGGVKFFAPQYNIVQIWSLVFP